MTPSRRAQRALALLCLIGTSSPAAWSASTDIRWGPCPASARTGDAIGLGLGQRLQCAEVSVPMDHHDPHAGTATIEVVRVTAAYPTQREGSIFLNVGGPGGHPGSVAAQIAALWAFGDPVLPAAREKRLLSNRFDLIAVVPRGLGARWRFDCVSGLSLTARFLPTNRDDANWQRTLDDASQTAERCRSAPGARYITTEQHVYDMEHVRRAIGDERIHFYGISYGALVGAWYAGTFPEHLGRMLLDSPFYFRDSFQSAMQLTLEADRRFFRQFALAPVETSPAAYGLTMEGDDIEPALFAMPAFLREAWYDRLTAPWHVAAALTIQARITANGWHGWNALARDIGRQAYSQPLRDAALDLVWPMDTPGPLLPTGDIAVIRGGEPQSGSLIPSASDSVWMATLCNDGPWWGSSDRIRARADYFATSFWTADGTDIAPYLVCTRWGGHSTDKPDMDRVGQVAPFLIVQSDLDSATPLRGAEQLHARYPNAHLVVARHSTTHGVFNQSDTPCVERAAAHFLLTGELPASPSRRTECAPPSRSF